VQQHTLTLRELMLLVFLDQLIYVEPLL